MTSSVLPFDEWEKLPEELDPVLCNIQPGTSRVLVVEDAGQIVGRWLLIPVLHAECLEIAPDYRKGVSVGRRLLRLMRETAKAMGVSHIWTASNSEAVTRMLAHPSIGASPVPALPFILPVEPPCHS